MGRVMINIDLSRQRLERHGYVAQENGCWHWGGNTFHKFGYGQLRINGVGYDAHRLTYRVYVDWNIDASVQVRHTCDNPPCVRPSHLVAGTSQDNHDDMVERGRALTGEKNPMAKLTSKQVEEVRTKISSGYTQTAVAKEYGVSQPLISVIVNGKRRRVG